MSLLADMFGAASWLRDARVFHPRGTAAHATWCAPAEPVLGGSGLAVRRAALIRVSHAVGLPPSVPDILGLAIRVMDAHGPGRHQDLLLASSGSSRIGRHLLSPAVLLTAATFSTLLPYEIPGEGRHPIVARATPGSVPASYQDVVWRGPTRLPSFELHIGTVHGALLATVHPAEIVASDVVEALAFDPWNTGPELEPVGWWNRVRRPTYAASQRGRRARRLGASRR